MDIEGSSSSSSQEQEIEEVKSLSEIINTESSEGEEITEEGIRSIEKIAALKIKDHSEEEKKERQQKKQIMDFKVRVAHLLELYVQRAPSLISIGKIVTSILQTHAQALSQNNTALLMRSRTLLKQTLRRGRKQQPAQLISSLNKNFQKLVTQYLSALRKQPKNASQIQKIILSIILNIQSSDQGEQKGEFFSLLRITLKTIMIHCFKGHLPHLDITTLKELVAPLQTELINVVIKCLSKLVLSAQNEGSRSQYQRTKVWNLKKQAIQLFQYCASLMIKREGSEHLSKLYSVIVKAAKGSVEEWSSWKQKPFKKIRPILSSFMRTHRILREKQLANITENGMKIVKKAASKIENEAQRNVMVKYLQNVGKD